MKLTRGDVGMARFPHVQGTRGKKRPVVVIQADVYNARVPHVIVAEVTSNLLVGNDPASLLIDVSTAEGQATGLVQNSVICCLFLATMAEDRITCIGKLSSPLLRRLDDCVKTALGLP